MNTLEREQLSRFLEELTMARVSIKDSEAEKLVQEACARQVDAPYLLVQRCLVLGQALQNAQAESARLQQELEKTRAVSGGFLSANAWGASASGQSPTPRPALSHVPPAQAASAAGASWGSGVLGGVATTAAGVVAGALLYQGVGHLMGNRGNGGGSSQGAHDATPLAEKSPESLMPNQSDLAAGDFDSIIPSDDDLGSMG